MKTLTKSELEKLYFSNENKKVCEMLGITNPTLIVYLKRFGIKPKGRGRRDKKYQLIDDTQNG